MNKKYVKKLKKRIAKERVDKLLSLAKKFSTSHSKLSQRYCKLIETIRKTVNLRLTKKQKMQYCKKCFTYWKPNKIKIRFNHSNKRIIYKCLNCQFEKIFSYKND